MRLLFISAIVCLLFASVNAQVKVHVNVNIGSQPAWGPSGFDYVDYYYLPDYDVYYYVPTHRFVIWDGGRWIFRSSLPPRFGHVDLYSVHKVVINEDKPYLRHEFYRDKYHSFVGMHDQKSIREFHQPRANVNKNREGHPGNDHGRGQLNKNENPGRGHDHEKDDHKKDK